MSHYKEIINVGQLELRFLQDGEDTDNRMVVFELLIPPAARVPAAHYHLEVDELVYVMEGTLTSHVNGKTLSLQPGESLFIPRGDVHQHDNLVNVTAKALCVLTPASIGPAYFRELGALIAAGGPPDKQKIVEIMARHGLVLAV